MFRDMFPCAVLGYYVFHPAYTVLWWYLYQTLPYVHLCSHRRDLSSWSLPAGCRSLMVMLSGIFLSFSLTLASLLFSAYSVLLNTIHSISLSTVRIVPWDRIISRELLSGEQVGIYHRFIQLSSIMCTRNSSDKRPYLYLCLCSTRSKRTPEYSDSFPSYSRQTPD